MSPAVHQPAEPGPIRVPQALIGSLDNCRGFLVELEPNTDIALAFLDALDGNGRHDLVAIDPDLPDKHPDKIHCATFLFPEQRERARAWIDQRQGKLNLYYSVNRAKADAPRNTRLDHEKRHDIEHIRASVHDFDLNLKEGASREDIESERMRLRRLAEDLATSSCPPTMINDTGGGGLHVVWQHTHPTPVTPENVAKAEGFGRAIKKRYGGDYVSDMPRIMRLVGTINVLSPGKRKTGRVPAVVEWLPELSSFARYTLDGLVAWMPPVQSATSADGGQDWTKVPIDMAVVDETQLDGELPATLKQRLEALKSDCPAVAGLWDGKPAPAQRDTSASGFEFALIGTLKGAEFTATETAQIVAVYPYRSEKHAHDLRRRVARAWLNKRLILTYPRLSPNGFDPQGAPGTPANPSAPSWEPPGDLWAIDVKPPELPGGGAAGTRGVVCPRQRATAWRRAWCAGCSPSYCAWISSGGGQPFANATA